MGIMPFRRLKLQLNSTQLCLIFTNKHLEKNSPNVLFCWHLYVLNTMSVRDSDIKFIINEFQVCKNFMGE